MHAFVLPQGQVIKLESRADTTASAEAVSDRCTTPLESGAYVLYSPDQGLGGRGRGGGGGGGGGGAVFATERKKPPGLMTKSAID